MIQSISSIELNRFSDLLTDHLNELTAELKVCADTKVNKLLRGEVSNASMINGLSKHKLFASSYEELTESSDDEPISPPPRKIPQERIKLMEREKVIVAKHATKKRSPKSIRDALLSVK